MPIKIQRVINVTMVLLAWLTIPFLGFRSIRRFLPAALIIVLIEGINVQIGKRRKWWFFYNKPKSYLLGEFPFNIGPFFVGSMWILKWTYGNFKQFMLLNATVNAFFAFILVRLMEKLKVAKLVRLNNFQFFLYFFCKAPLLYGIQYIIESKKEIFINLKKGFSQIRIKKL
jgi:hypothetical protein